MITSAGVRDADKVNSGQRPAGLLPNVMGAMKEAAPLIFGERSAKLTTGCERLTQQSDIR